MAHDLCPGREQLRAFHEGRLPDASVANVEAHLQACLNCVQWLEELGRAEDALLRLLRRHPPAFLARSTETASQPVTPAASGAGREVVRLPAEKYEVLRELGRGGMGIVYLARQVKAKRLVALKVIRSSLYTTMTEKIRFQIEAEAIANLQHPNIVQLYELDEHEGFPFFSAEFIEGESLACQLKREAPCLPETCRMVEVLARAVHYAHGRGVIHRDLKPANIMLTKEGALKITDFGLAKRLGAESNQTLTGAVMGTPSYMAPEQAQGKNHTVGPACDIYALGAILYECLTGRPPFRGESITDTLNQVVATEPVPPRQLRHAVALDLQTICLKCLSKNPAQRYPTALELAEDLALYQDQRPIRARPVGRWERGRKWVQRYPARFALSAASLLLLTAAPTALLWIWHERSAATAAEEQTHKQRYYQNITLADRAWSAGQWTQAEKLLKECAPFLRRWEWHHLTRRISSASLDLIGHEGMVNDVSWSADGAALASAGADGTVRLWDAQTRRERLSFSGHAGSVTRVAFGPNSSIFSTGSDRTVRMWDADTGAERRRLGEVPFVSRSLAYSARRQLLAVGYGVMNVKLWQGDTEQATTLFGADLPDHGRTVTQLAISPDGLHLAITRDDNADAVLKVWNLQQNRQVFVHTAPRRIFREVAFSVDGSTLAVISNPKDNRTPFSSEVILFDWASGRFRQTLRGHQGTIYVARFSPAGEYLATSGLDRSIRLWDGNSGEQTLVLRTPAEITSLAFAPGGDHLASACVDGLLRIWGTASEQGVVSFPGKVVVNHVAYSADGSLLASADGSGKLTVRQTANGQEVFHGRHKGPWRGAIRVSFNADGTVLASAAKDDAVRLWSLITKEGPRLLPHARANAVEFSPDGRFVATAGDDHSVKVWETGSGKEIRHYQGHRGAVFALSFSPDGLHLASASRDQTVRVWNLHSGAEPFVYHGHTQEVAWVAFSPDGSAIASASELDLKVWDAHSGRERVSLPGHSLHITSLAWSPDGNRLASAGDDGTIKLWELEHGLEVLTLSGHRGGVTSLMFNAQGSILASSSWDGAVKLWHGGPLSVTSQ